MTISLVWDGRRRLFNDECRWRGRLQLPRRFAPSDKYVKITGLTIFIYLLSCWDWRILQCITHTQINTWMEGNVNHKHNNNNHTIISCVFPRACLQEYVYDTVVSMIRTCAYRTVSVSQYQCLLTTYRPSVRMLLNARHFYVYCTYQVFGEVDRCMYRYLLYWRNHSIGSFL